MKFRILVCFIIIIFFPISISSQVEIGNKIIINLSPDSLISDTNYDYITVTLKNISTDTLLSVIEPFSLDGLFLDVQFVIGPISSYFRPNEIYFYPKVDIRLEGRGEYPLRFLSIPKIVIIKPNSDLNINVYLNEEYKQFLFPLDWKLYCCIRYTEKNIMDSIIYSKYPSLICEYKKSLIDDDEIELWGIKNDTLFKNYNRDNDRNFKNLSEIDKIMMLFNKLSCYNRINN